MRQITTILVLALLAIGASAQTETILIPGDSFVNSFFGSDVAIDGDLAVVGAYADDSFAMDAGAVYVFRHNGLTWVESEELLPADIATQDRFGERVAVQGDLVVGGAPYKNDAVFGVDSGAVYIYRDNGVTMTLEQKITSSDLAAGDLFGSSLAVDGNVVAVGAAGDGGIIGSVYVFEFDGTTWNETHKLTGSDNGFGDGFGTAIALDGDWMVIGIASKDEVEVNAGAAYVFHFDGTTWTEVQKLTASDPGADDHFGGELDIDGNVIVIGAHEHEDGTDVDTGAAYVFRESGLVWTEEQKLQASNRQDLDKLGRSVSVSGELIVVGTQSDIAAINAGSTVLFAFDGTTWSEDTELTASDWKFGDDFGGSVATDGANIIIGARHADPLTGGQNSGKAYIYTWDGDVNYPGTGDDLELRSGVNGPIDGVDIKAIDAGDTVTLNLRSPGGTFDQAPFYLLAQAFVTGAPPAPFAGFHFDLTQQIFVLLDSSATPFGPVELPASGATLAFGIAGVTPGSSVMIQGLGVSGTSVNGFFGTTGGHELRMP